MLFQPQRGCDEIIVMHLGYLNYTQYKVDVDLIGLENLTYGIREVTFVVRLEIEPKNPVYT